MYLSTYLIRISTKLKPTSMVQTLFNFHYFFFQQLSFSVFSFYESTFKFFSFHLFTNSKFRAACFRNRRHFLKGVQAREFEISLDILEHGEEGTEHRVHVSAISYQALSLIRWCISSIPSDKKINHLKKNKNSFLSFCGYQPKLQ